MAASLKKPIYRLASGFGEFSPVNFGVTIKVARSLGNLLPTVQSVFATWDEEERIEILSDALDRATTDDSRWTLLSYATVECHERRHFHEMLATRCGQALVFDRIFLASFCYAVGTELGKQEAIVIPLLDWEEMSDRTFRVAQSVLAPKQLSRKPPQLTSRLVRKFHGILKELRFLTERIGEIPSNLEISVLQLLEANAVEVQLAKLRQIYPEKMGESYFKLLQDRDIDQTYTRLGHEWLRLVRKMGLPSSSFRDPRTAALRNAIVFFSLCAVHKDETSPCIFGPGTFGSLSTRPPGGIFWLLLTDLYKDKKLPKESEIPVWLDDKARTHGFLSLSESLKRSINLARSRSDFLSDFCREGSTTEIEGTPVPHFLNTEMLEAYNSWVDAHDYMCTQIMAEPLSFFNPDEYVKNMDRWVGSPTFFLTDADILNTTSILPSEDGDGIWRLVAHSLTRGGVEMFNWKTIVTLSTMMRMANIFWLRSDESDTVLYDPFAKSWIRSFSSDLAIYTTG